MINRIIPLILLFLIKEPITLQSQIQFQQEKFDTFISISISLSEKLFYSGKFDEAQKYLRLSFFEDFEWYRKKHQIALISQHAKIELFKNSLSQNRSKYGEILQNLLMIASTAQELEDKATYGNYLSTLAYAYLYNANSDSALYFYSEASKLFKEIGDEQKEADVRAFLIMIRHNKLYREENRDKILKLVSEYEKEIEFAAGVGNKLAQSYNTRHLGRIYLNHIKDLDKAYELYESSLSLREAVGFRLYVPPSYSSLGDILNQKGDTAKAMEMYFNSIEIAEEVSFVRYLFHPRLKIGDIYQKEGNYEMARKFYKEALKVASINQYLDGIDEAVRKLSNLSD